MANYKEAQNILVTGPSGSGKSFAARKLSEEKKLPLVKLDDYPEWKAFEKTREDYVGVAKRLVYKALKEPGRKIIEGQQILSLDELPKGHKVILIDPGKETTVVQRLRRSIKKAKKEGKKIDSKFVESKKRTAEELYDLSSKDAIRLGLKKESQWSKPTTDFWNDTILQNLDYARYLLGHKYNVGAAGIKAGLSPGKIIAHDYTKFKPRTFDVYEDYFYGPKGITGNLSPKVYKAFREEVEKHYRAEPHHRAKLGLPKDVATEIESVADWYSVGKTKAGMRGQDFPNFVDWWNARKLGFLAKGSISKNAFVKIETTLKKDYNIVTYSFDQIKELFK
jgi:adenylate kinase family enzyme